MMVTLGGLANKQFYKGALLPDAPSQLAMRRRATSSQRRYPLPRSRSHNQRRADVGSRFQAGQSAT